MVPLARLPLCGPILAALIAFGGAGCDTLECQDGGRLEVAYQEGQAQAAAQNEADFQRGQREGLGLSFADGEREGYQVGFDEGYASGYWNSGDYEAGYSTGYSLGFDEGAGDPGACEGGDEAGYTDGFTIGESDGYSVGYEIGFDDYYRPCTVAPNRLSPRQADEDAPTAEDIGQCHSRGVNSARDTGAFLRGRSAGIAANDEYLAGYGTQYEVGLDDGAREGEQIAYDEGLSIGYSDGAEEGWESAWYGCYDIGFPDGYNAGYDDGYQSGYSEGSYEGDLGEGC